MVPGIARLPLELDEEAPAVMRIACCLVLSLCWAGTALAVVFSYNLVDDTALLDDAFYAGEASDGSDVSGRLVLFFNPSNDGTMVALGAINIATLQEGLFIVDVGKPSSWRRVTPDGAIHSGNPAWTPDDSHIYWNADRINVDTEAVETSVFLHGYLVWQATMSRLPIDNWLVSHINSGGNQQDLALLPILNDGSEDTGRNPVIVTNFTFDSDPDLFPSFPSLNRDATSLTFAYRTEQFPVDFVPDLSDVYAIEDLRTIMNASKLMGTDISSLAPTLLTSPSLTEIRVGESANFAHCMRYSEDSQLILYCEDFNNTFNDDYFLSILTADFDVMLSLADGSGTDIRIAKVGNQSSTKPFPGGLRLLYLNVSKVFLTTLKITNNIAADVSGLPEGETEATIGGGQVPLPFVLTDSAVQMQTNVIFGDGSGASVNLADETVINFPAGSGSTSITTSTPLFLSGGGLGVSKAIAPREFGPDDTEFFPPLEITLTYTDEDVRDMDESILFPIIFNETFGVYTDIVPEEDIVFRDEVNNSITFTIDHFSTYALTDSAAVGLPVTTWWIRLSAALAVIAIGVFVLSRRSRKNDETSL